MKTITIKKDLYTFDELPQDAQERAVNDLINAWTEMPQLVPDNATADYNRAGKKAEAMRTPWFFGSYIWEYCRDAINAELRLWYYDFSGDHFTTVDQVDEVKE